ncbi:MAG: ester cyclase [Burkholderiales bacterium]|nr:ester cyclase [Burkholderiales bacterium]
MVVRGRVAGRHRATFMGLPATRREVDIAFIAIYRVEAGRIAERWLVGDELAMMRQLGVVPAPGGH